MLEQVCIS